MEMDQAIKVAFRLDNLYKYDVEVDCKRQSWNYTTDTCADLNASALSTLLGNSKVSFIEEAATTSAAAKNGSRLCCQLKGGYSIMLLQEIVNTLNLRVQLVTGVDSNNFTQELKSSVDMYVGLKALREEVVRTAGGAEISYPIGFTNMKVFVNHEHESQGRDIIYESMQPQVWFALLGLIVVNVLVLVMLYKLTPSPPTEPYLEAKFKPSSSTRLGMIVFETFATAIQKGTYLIRQRTYTSIRIVLLFVSLAFFMFMSAYSASIMAVLSVPLYKVTSLNALTRSYYDVLLHRSQNMSSLDVVLRGLSNEDSTIMQILQKASRSKVRFQSFDKTVVTMQQKPLAWVTWDDSGFNAINNVFGGMPCSWSQMPVRNIKFAWTFYMKRKSPFKTDVNNLLFRMAETGLLRYHQKKWLPQQTKYCEITQKMEIAMLAVEITNVYTTFIILAIGSVMAIVVLSMERLLQVQKECNVRTSAATATI